MSGNTPVIPNPLIRITETTLSQPPDDLQFTGSSSSPGSHQHLRIRIEDAGAGAYATLSTRRWAVDKEDMAALMERIAGLIEAHDRAMDKEFERS